MASKWVKAVPRLKDDLQALLELTNHNDPPQIPVRPPCKEAHSGRRAGAVYGEWTADISQQYTSNFCESANLVQPLRQKVHSGRIKRGSKVFVFTDNAVAESTMYKGSSKLKLLHELVVGLRKVAMMTGDVIIRFVWISGKRMIWQGTGISPVTPNMSRAAYTTKRLGSGLVLDDQRNRLEVHQTKGLVKHIFPQSRHIFLCPTIMTGVWRKQLLKVADMRLTVVNGSKPWPKDIFEPLTIALISPPLSSRPWKVGKTAPAEKWKHQMQRLSFNDCKAFRDHLNNSFIDKSLLEDEDPTRFKEARNRDRLMTPFQCDLCHFVNANLSKAKRFVDKFETFGIKEKAFPHRGLYPQVDLWGDPVKRKFTTLQACLFISGFYGGLREEELNRVDLGGIRKCWNESLRVLGDKWHVPLVLSRTFKREVGLKLYMQPLACVTKRNIDICLWFSRALKAYEDEEGTLTGPLFCNRSKNKWAFVSDMDLGFQENIDVTGAYSTYRSLCRGSTAEAQNAKIPKEVIEANKRWRKLRGTYKTSPYLANSWQQKESSIRSGSTTALASLWKLAVPRAYLGGCGSAQLPEVTGYTPMELAQRRKLTTTRIGFPPSLM
eukprot:jgi/Psemu1/3727/gm1.3727_g